MVVKGRKVSCSGPIQTTGPFAPKPYDEAPDPKIFDRPLPKCVGEFTVLHDHNAPRMAPLAGALRRRSVAARKVKDAETGEILGTVKEAAEKLGLHPDTIYSCCNLRWTGRKPDARCGSMRENGHMRTGRYALQWAD